MLNPSAAAAHKEANKDVFKIFIAILIGLWLMLFLTCKTLKKNNYPFGIFDNSMQTGVSVLEK
ncbi:hypothetical protein [Acinetobacter pragensis]|uniref:hypothetical protein n=1 Tax=Acinetobacter pragensis TaxID=1806892 RepID=UPI000AB4D88F|nr:hypothetical protein [Acinetobacter pragensis]